MPLVPLGTKTRGITRSPGQNANSTHESTKILQGTDVREASGPADSVRVDEARSRKIHDAADRVALTRECDGPKRRGALRGHRV
jgi:hypothetical protein